MKSYKLQIEFNDKHQGGYWVHWPITKLTL